jgi:hypothetical protein
LKSFRFFTGVINNKLILAASPELQISLYSAYIFLAELDFRPAFPKLVGREPICGQSRKVF